MTHYVLASEAISSASSHDKWNDAVGEKIADGNAMFIVISV